MKRIYLFCFISLILSSCYNNYQFVQVHEYSLDDGNTTMKYDDGNCIFDYSGISYYTIYNKTNTFVFVDKSKTFGITNSGRAFNFKDASASISSENIYNNIKTDFNKSNEDQNTDFIVYSTSDVVVIPPQAYKIFYVNTDYPELILDCSLPQYPDSAASIQKHEIISTVLTTYRTDGNQKEYMVKNNIYLDKITNYAEPVIIEYIPRGIVCENMRESGKYYSDREVYDYKYKVGINTRTFPYYLKNTSKRIYDYEDSYVYDYDLNGYVKR